MPRENTTLWTLDAHTIGKHRVLESLHASVVTLSPSSWNERIVFIDAFAGPGEYTDPDLHTLRTIHREL